MKTSSLFRAVHIVADAFRGLALLQLDIARLGAALMCAVSQGAVSVLVIIACFGEAAFGQDSTRYTKSSQYSDVYQAATVNVYVAFDGTVPPDGYSILGNGSTNLPTTTGTTYVPGCYGITKTQPLGTPEIVGPLTTTFNAGEGGYPIQNPYNTAQSYVASGVDGHPGWNAEGGKTVTGVEWRDDSVPASYTPGDTIPPSVINVTIHVSVNPSQPPDPGATKPTDTTEGGDVPTETTETTDDSNDGGGDDCVCPTCEPGMLRYGAHALFASLRMSDRPLSYTPAFGPKIDFRISYSYQDLQPTPPVDAATNGFSNLGPQWTFNWLSYVTDNPTDTSQAAVYVRGGGTETYTQFDAPSQTYARDPQSHALLIRLTANSYEKDFPDGCRYLYAQSDGSVAYPRHIFLTQVIDPHGNAATLNYDDFNRLENITDATGKVTTFSYGNSGWYYLVTQITDPFNRSAQIQYYPDGRLQSITDAIGLTSTVQYEAGDNFINQLTTPYTQTTTLGAATFSHGEDATGRWVQMTDALGSSERVEYRDNAAGISNNDTAAPAGVFNDHLNIRNTFFWDKKAMLVAPGNYTQAHVTHWLMSADGSTTVGVPQCEKSALESRIWYSYLGQTEGDLEGSSGEATNVARLLDDGSTQSYQFTRNEWGHPLQRIDPIGRTTTYVYFDNDIDLQYVYQQNGGANELLSTMGNYVGHQPQTITDASGQVTNISYTPYGQVDTLTNAKNEVAKNVYYTDPTQPGFGRVNTITRAFGTPSAATHTLTYDSFDRVWTATDEDNYTLTFYYDAIGGDPTKSLDRLTQILHPDGTSEFTVYHLLDAEDHYDRLGRLTHTPHDALQRISSATDPNNNTVKYCWCVCGALDKIIDANGVVTQWIRDIQKRPKQKIINNVTVATTTYENSTSRVQSVLDGNGQTKSFTYYTDNQLSTVTYLDATSTLVPMLSVGYIYDQNYDRISSMNDGMGVTNYSYNPITNPPVLLGEGKLATVSGPSGNQPVGYTISYAYDELGRRIGRTVAGAANGVSLADNAASLVYDALGRVNPTITNVLGSFGYFYVGQTTRLDHLTYPNSQQVKFGYDTNASHDRQLLEIQNLDPTGAVLSQFDYTHATTGRIETWTQSNPTLANPQQYTFGYDSADQLRTANLTDTGSGATLALSSYSYDPAGNRLTSQSDNNVSTVAYNFPFQLQLDPGGLMYFSGSLNENATLTIGVQAATVTANPGGAVGQPYLFSGWAPVVAGANTLAIVATEADVVPGLNPKVTSQHIQLSVASFASQTVSLDNVGNMANDFQSSTFGWDAANRLATISSVDGTTTTLIYDGLGRRVKVVQTGTVNSERHYIWDGMSLVEERDGSNQVTKRYFGEGEQRVSGASNVSYFYTRDHLGSLREMTDQNGTVHARYSYSPWGQRTKQSGDLDADFGFTGHFYHAPSQLHLAPYRAYSTNLGRWLSRDPLQEKGGINLYEYANNDPVDLFDPEGLLTREEIAAGRDIAFSGLVLRAQQLFALQNGDIDTWNTLQEQRVVVGNAGMSKGNDPATDAFETSLTGLSQAFQESVLLGIAIFGPKDDFRYILTLSEFARQDAMLDWLDEQEEMLDQADELEQKQKKNQFKCYDLF